MMCAIILIVNQIIPIYQSIRMFDTDEISPGAPDALSFEHFLPWIWKIMLAYQDPDKKCGEEMLPQGTSFSKGYFSKKVN
jgi:hypothetical protein